MIPDDEIELIRTRPGNDEDTVRLLEERALLAAEHDAMGRVMDGTEPFPLSGYDDAWRAAEAFE